MIARYRRKYPVQGPPENVWQAAERGLDFAPRPATMATVAEPGSREKIVVLMERIRHGQELWNAGDRAWPWQLSEKIKLPACTGRPGKGYFSVEDETL